MAFTKTYPKDRTNGVHMEEKKNSKLKRKYFHEKSIPQKLSQRSYQGGYTGEISKCITQK